MTPCIHVCQVAHLPGHLRFVEQVRVVGAEALQPQVIARMCCFSRLASLHACFGGVVVSNQQMQALCSLTCLGWEPTVLSCCQRQTISISYPKPKARRYSTLG